MQTAIKQKYIKYMRDELLIMKTQSEFLLKRIQRFSLAFAIGGDFREGSACPGENAKKGILSAAKIFEGSKCY